MNAACIASPLAKLVKIKAAFPVVQAQLRFEMRPKRARAKTKVLTSRKICTEAVIVTELDGKKAGKRTREGVSEVGSTSSRLDEGR